MTLSPEPTEPTDASEIKENLCNALDVIRAAGSFAAFQTIPSLAPVSVREVGVVPFPLTEEYAHKLIDKSRLAPFGKGEETIVDTSVRNTWELDASQLEFMGNQEWIKTISAASTWVAAELGITSSVKVEPYKMLIYEPGALFKPHTDTEKIPGMFGTLVICLPSEHTGGDLVVKHRGEAKIFQTSSIQPCMLSWYSDVSHEVLPVTSGYRWVLTFNLATSETAHAPSVDLPVGYYELQDALQKWLEFRKSDKWDGTLYSPYYILEHSYTEASISLNALKGDDRLRMQALKRACEATNVSLYFGIVEKAETGSCENCDSDEDDEDDEEYQSDSDVEDDNEDNDGNGDREARWHEFDDIIETEYSIKKIVTPGGQGLLTKVNSSWSDISENNSIQDIDDPFEGTAELMYFIVKGVTATHWYRATVAIIVPTGDADAFLATAGVRRYTAHENMRTALTQCANDERTDHALKMAHCLARILWYPNVHGHSTLALEVLEMSLRYRQYQLFNCVMMWFNGFFEVAPLAQLFSMVKRVVAEGSFDFRRIKDRLLKAWMRCKWEHRAELILAIAPLQEQLPEIRAWISDDLFEEVINACDVGKATEADAAGISTLVIQYESIEYFKKRIATVIQKQASNTPFALAAILGVMHHAIADGFNRDECVELCKPLLKSVIEALDVAKLCSNTLTPPPKVVSHLRPAPTTNEERIISTTILVDFFVQCHQLKWEDLSALLCHKIAEKANLIPSPQLRDLWAPFLQSLIPALVAEKASLAIKTWLKSCVGQEPSGRPNYQQKLIGCNCEDCNLLDVFLNANQQVWRFKALKWRRQHLEDRLRKARADCSLATDTRGSPQTLVVTKGLDRGTRAKNAWTERFNAAWALISMLDQAQLNQLLGGEYDRLVSMRHLRYPRASTENAPSDDSPRGVKRKEL
ncbi:hypothetical protein DFS34DRAFT_590673 [Phlyctochytrium arcticum]|nr:hypothetical protein DFS34DRAFT_590673 [Phlyctochytrium arcticum]